MMTCSEATGLASAWIDGELPLWTRLRVRVHLAMCEGCRRFFRQLRLTTGLVRTAPAEPAPPSDDEVADVLQQVLAAGPGKPDGETPV